LREYADVGFVRTLVAAAILGASAPAAAQQATTCFACHASQNATLPAVHRTDDWIRSGHATVGCQGCHGGNPTTLDARTAHRGVIDAVSPFSTLHPINLTQTCSLCHRASAAPYFETLHQLLADAGDRRAPTCATCHGVTFTYVPSPAETEQLCASCHRPGSARASYPGTARRAVEAIAALRARGDAAGAARADAAFHQFNLQVAPFRQDAVNPAMAR
jgi:hypothetical protein